MNDALVRPGEEAYPAVHGRPARNDSLPVWRLWRVLGHNRLLIATCTTALVVTTAYFTSRITPKYEASASIRIEQGEPRLGDFGMSRAPTPNELPTEFQVLQSRTLLEAVADSLGLQLEVRAPANVSRPDLSWLDQGLAQCSAGKV